MMADKTCLQRLGHEALTSDRMFNVLTTFSINLLVFYHECCSLIGYATHYSVIDSEERFSTKWRLLRRVFKVSAMRI